MRILLATSSQYFAFHGQAIFTKNLAEGLVKNGHTVLALTASDKGKFYRFEHKGVHIDALPTFTLNAIHPELYVPIFSTPSIKRAILTLKPDILHIQDHYSLCHNAIMYACRRGIKTVGTNHFMPENLAPYLPLISRIKPIFNQILWRWMRATYDRADAVTVPSCTAAGLLRSAGVQPPVLSISCGANTVLFHTNPLVDRPAWRIRYGMDPHKITFFFVGRVDGEKHLDVLLHAMSILNRDDIQLVIAGRGAQKDGLIRLSNQLELGAKVHFTGFLPQEDLPSVLNSIDIFAMPSEAELLSISTLQAMACSRPILAADAVALPELVTEKVNGLLFKPRDVADAARCLAWFADHPERWSDMGAASLEKSRPHGIEKIVPKYETLYKQILSGVPHDGMN